MELLERIRSSIRGIDFEYEVELVPDGKFGAPHPYSKIWNGMVGEVVRGVRWHGWEQLMLKLNVYYTAKLLFHQLLCCTVTTKLLDSDSVVTVANFRQHGDYTTIGSSVIVLSAATVTKLSLFSHQVVTVPSRWLMEWRFCCTPMELLQWNNH